MSYLQDKTESLLSCENCRYFGFPCLNCAEYQYNYKYGPGYGRNNANDPDVLYLIEKNHPNNDNINNIVVCYTIYEVEDFKSRYPNAKVRELKYNKNENCFL